MSRKLKTALMMLALLTTHPLVALDALAEPRADHGLCVILPAVSGRDLAEQCNGGKLLAHGLAQDDVTLEIVQSEIQTLGVSGLATVSKFNDSSRLPFASNLVNLLFCDADALGEKTPAREELLRVLVPEGELMLRAKGVWSRIMKPRPPEIDQWTHFDYNAAGTGVSHDKHVAPPTALQWRMELEPYSGLGGNPAAYRPYTGFRLSGGRAFFALATGMEEKGKPKNAQIFTVGRDAFNGLPIWKIPSVSSGSGSSQEYQFVANDTRVFTFLERDVFAVALDAASGKVVTLFDKGAKFAPKKNLHPAYYMLRATNDVLIQCAEEKLFALNARSGELKWVHEERDGYVCFPRILEKEKRVLVQVVEKGLDRIQGRWANIKTSALLCLSLETGKEIWRSSEIKDLNFGQAIAAGDSIYMFNPAGIGASEEWNNKKGKGGGLVAKLSAIDGKLLWKSEPFKWGYNLLVREGKPFFATPSELNTLSPQDGALSAFWKASFNNRCNRTSATDDWIIAGMGNYIDKDGVATVKGISRGGCAQGVVVGNGLTYFTPNTCHCITMLRGHLACSAEPLRASVADEHRLEKSGAFATPTNSKPTDLNGLISSEWLPQMCYGAPETVPTKDGETEIVSVIHAHRVECRQNGKVLWSMTVGARVSQPPIVSDGMCFFGGHDGYLYCLNAQNGKLQWRFLAAPYERNIVSHGQLESSWPVYNAVIHEGKVCCSAGLHPETGGGIHVWGLDQKSGAIVWRKCLKRSELLVKPGGKIAPNRVMNSPLKSDGTKLSLVGVEFTSDEPEAAINQRIDNESMGDKNRNWGWSLRGPMIENGKK